MRNEDKIKLRFVSTAKGTSVLDKICDECIADNAKYAMEKCPLSDESSIKCKNMQPYFFFQEKNEKKIIVFSQMRIPFDFPKLNVDIIKNFKNTLIQAIKNLQIADNCILQARYGTTEKTFYDIENVLFYNLGTANFHAFTEKGVIFSAISDMEIKNLHKDFNIPTKYSHYYEYSIVERKTKNFNSLLAEWNNIPLKCIGLKPAYVWSAFKEHTNKIFIKETIDCDKRDTFAIFLEIKKPKDVSFHIMTAMKPLLDGLICAFHRSEFNENELTYFSQILNCEKDILTSRELSVLGQRKSKYLQIYQNNVKWNPADDLCDYVSISIKNSNDWKLSGKIYSTVKCPKCGKGKLSKLLWGMPAFSPEIIEAEKLGKIKFAGCVVKAKSRYYCRWCKNKF